MDRRKALTLLGLGALAGCGGGGGTSAGASAVPLGVEQTGTAADASASPSTSTAASAAPASTANAAPATSSASAQTYPDNYVDIRSWLVSRADGSLAQDLIDRGNDATPTSLRFDAIHLNDAGCDVVAAKLRDFISAKGW